MNSKIKTIILFMVIIFIYMMFVANNAYNVQVNKQEEFNTEVKEKDNVKDIAIEPTEIIFEQAPSEKMAEAEKEPELVNLGRFVLTAYCSCIDCCGEYALNRPIDENGNEIVYGSIGVRLTAGISIAVDPRVIPYNSNVIINGHTYTAHDTGSAVNGYHIDVYFNNHQEALNFGVQYADVYLVKNENYS